MLLDASVTTWVGVALAALNVLQTIALAYLAVSHKSNGHL